MASFRGVHGVMQSLEAHLQRALPTTWQQGTINARVALLGSRQMAAALTGNLLGIYLHRITVDAHGRNRPLPPVSAASSALQAELPVNLHFLLIANGASADIEANLMSWGMIALANEVHLDLSQVGDSDPEWGRREQVAISPVEMSDEDLMRIWDQFEATYTLTVPYVMRTVRLRLGAEPAEGPDVGTRAFPVGTLGG